VRAPAQNEEKMTTNRKTRIAARRLFRQCLAAGVLDERRAHLAVQRIADDGRRGSLGILWEFLRLVRLDSARHTAVVETAVPLADELRDGVRARLTGVYGKGLKTSFALNPALIGGMRVRVGSDVFDGSVRARLAALEARF